MLPSVRPDFYSSSTFWNKVLNIERHKKCLRRADLAGINSQFYLVGKTHRSSHQVQRLLVSILRPNKFSYYARRLGEEDGQRQMRSQTS